MTYENIKSIVLSFLVIVSIALTWGLWTFQPNYETMKQGNYVEEVAISERKEIKKIVKPDRIIFHYQDSHYGVVDNITIDKTIAEMSRWSFSNLKEHTRTIEDFSRGLHGSGRIEIIYPGLVPLSIYKNVLKFEDKSLPSFEFDRIVINMDSAQKENGIVYFVSYRTGQIYMSNVNPNSFEEINNKYFKTSYRFPRYMAYQIRDHYTIFLPEGKPEMLMYKYYPNPLDSEKFKEALFSDPSYVKKSFVSSGEEFTDSYRKMEVNYNTNMIYYVNPPDQNDYLVGSNDVIQKSINFINSHSGWTDAYRFVFKDHFNQRVVFRLYNIDGFPVFNEYGMSEILQVWGKNEINRYIRPRFHLELPLKPETVPKKLPSGTEAIEYLQEVMDLKPELLEDITIGYRMGNDPSDPSLIILEPAWYYLYDNSWRKMIFDQEEGINHGLE